jgi:hypothetical protein
MAFELAELAAIYSVSTELSATTAFFLLKQDIILEPKLKYCLVVPFFLLKQDIILEPKLKYCLVVLFLPLASLA